MTINRDRADDSGISPIRIVHVITSLSVGGAERMLQRLIEGHRLHPDYRHEVISLREIGSVGAELRARGISVEALGLTSLLGAPRTLTRLVRLLRRYEPDVVQCWMYHADLLGGIAARLAGVRAIIWGVRVGNIFSAMGVPRSTLAVRWLCAVGSRFIPAVIVYVAEAARRLHEAVGYDPGKGEVIHNGFVVPDRTVAARARDRCRAALGTKVDTLLIGSAGRFSPQKGFDAFVAASAVAAERDPTARFLLFGPGVSPDNPVLADWISERNLTERFHLLGSRDDARDWLAALDVFVLASKTEGLPNIVAEAMSVGVPCVVTDVGDAALLVGTAGEIIPAGDQAALDSALLRMLDRIEVRAAMGERARERIIEHFSMATALARWEDLYRRLVACASGARRGTAGVRLAGPSE